MRDRTSRDAAALASHLERLSQVLLGRLGRAQAPPGAREPARGALDMLADAHALSRFEADVLLVAVGVAVDADFARLVVAAGGARNVAPTVSGVLAVLIPDRGARLRARPLLGSEGSLMRYRLIRRRPIDAGEHELVATRRSVAAALGRHPLEDLPAWAGRSVPATEPYRWTDLDPRLVAASLRGDRPPGALCVVRGAAGSGRTTWARSAVHAIGPRALVIDIPRALAEADAPAEAIAELCEDAAVAGIPVILDDAEEALGRGAPLVVALLDVLERVPLAAIAVVDAATAIDPRVARRALNQTTIGPPPVAIRHQLWGGDCARDGLGVVAEELVLNPAQIANARRLIAAGVEPLAAALSQIDRGQDLLQLQRDRLRLDDLIVADDVRGELGELITAIRVRGQVAKRRSSRGNGISALFDGEPGTGKTLACDVVACEVQLPLMRVNVAALVDKYIGETEKNLTRVFAQARARGDILLFDEADALFATRTEVGRAQDRYANLETNLLLQLLEEHPGIVLLTTNLRSNMDHAFMRRLTFKICFDVPDAARRERLWRCHLPHDHAVDDRGLARLAASFGLAGGGIKSAVVRACYRAVGARRRVDLDDLAECAQLEVAAMGKVAAW